MSDPVVVYLIVHELFGVLFTEKKITLVTPVVPPHADPGGKLHEHKYKIARFKDGKWDSDVAMRRNAIYRLSGVKKRTAVATNIPCHLSFSSNPPGTFVLSKSPRPFCKWELSLPKQIHQLRLVSIQDSDRPVFVGDPHGDAVEAQLAAVSLVQAFEYEQAPKETVIVTENRHPVKLDYEPDKVTQTINLHIWAQLEDESGMDDAMANQHAKEASGALVKLFSGLIMDGAKSLSIDNLHTTQVRTPAGIRFPEVMSLAERFSLLGHRLIDNLECTAKTCGHGGNLYLKG
jgi:hypothetical protein